MAFQSSRTSGFSSICAPHPAAPLCAQTWPFMGHQPLPCKSCALASHRPRQSQKKGAASQQPHTPQSCIMKYKKAGQPSVRQCGLLSGPSNTAELQIEVHPASASEVLQQCIHMIAALVSPSIHFSNSDSHCQHNNDAYCTFLAIFCHICHAAVTISHFATFLISFNCSPSTSSSSSPGGARASSYRAGKNLPGGRMWRALAESGKTFWLCRHA